MPTPWLETLPDPQRETLSFLSQWQGAIGLAAAFAGIWIGSRSGGRALDGLLLRAGRLRSWGLVRMAYLGLVAGLCSPGRGQRDLDAVSLTATGRASGLGSSWFAAGAALTASFFGLGIWAQSLHQAVPTALAGAAAAGLALFWRERQRTLGAIGGVTTGWSLLLFCLLYTSPSPRDRTRTRMPSSA